MPEAGAKRDFSGSLSLRGQYDSNFARSNDTTAASRGIEPEEYSLSPNVSVRMVQPLGRQVLFVSGGAGYTFYRTNDQLNRARGQVQGGLSSRLGPCGLFTTAGFSAAQSDLALVDSPNVKNIAQSTTYGAGLQCSRGRSIGGGLSVQHAETRNSAAIQKLANSETNSVSANIGYGNERVGRIGLAYGYAESKVPNRLTGVGPTGDGFNSQNFSVSAERRFGPRLYARALAGRVLIKRDFTPPGVDPEFWSSTYSGGLDYQIGSRIKLSLSADRGVTPSMRAGKLLDMNTSARAGVTYNLGSRFVIDVGHSIQDVKSNADTSIPLLVITNSRTNSTFASVRFKQSERASIVLDASYDDRSANLRQFNYSATRVGVAAEVAF